MKCRRSYALKLRQNDTNGTVNKCHLTVGHSETFPAVYNILKGQQLSLRLYPDAHLWEMCSSRQKNALHIIRLSYGPTYSV